MSLTRTGLTCVQAVAHYYAMTPPHKTKNKDRYHTEEIWILQIAPYVFFSHTAFLCFCTIGEILSYLFFLSPTVCASLPHGISSCSSPILPTTTPLFLIGTLSLLLGTWIRLDCFKALGKFFTFDLTVHEDHRLVTERFYGYVRHPSYTGSLLLVLGITLAHLTEGSWFIGASNSSGGLALRLLGTGVWWVYCLSVGISRARAEDKQMHKSFGEEWERYRDRVWWWFLPGLL
ncbi:hypothetical protein PM082_014980 [Marasmius tenuissimus]|nr:hypothetical protein PM082_014980 [Marasmius tenuissimus]